MDPEILEDWARKMRALMILAGLLFAILFLRLFHLQITTADDYAKESEDNRIAQRRLKAPRGLVVDRDGEVLARNRAAYSIQLIRGSSESDAEAIAVFEEATGQLVQLGKRGRERTIRLKRDVDFPTVAIVEERLRDEWPLDVAIEPQRLYPHGALAAHIIGYMGEQQDDLASSRGRPYVAGDYVGQTGLERVYQDSLRGWDGVNYVEVDVRERVINDHPFPDRERAPRPGRDLRLTVDMDIQRAAAGALPESLAGSVVALDARTGAVLALVSHPSYDPNVFVSYGSQTERQRLIQDPAKPMLNRAIQGGYPPGSTLKMIGAVAALENGITDTLSTFAACAGSLQVGDVVFRCNNREGHGELNLLEAMETSCNIYFNHLAQILGIEAWHEFGARFGFGMPTHIDLDPSELSGILPDRQFHKEREGWVTGHLMNLVIGQGYMLVTPLQMARYVAALGNGGYLVTPHLSGEAPDPVRLEGISDATLDIVRRAMYRVVHGENGTGKRARIAGIELAGKSGTAQGPRADDDAWFVAFAPYEDPEIAVAVVVEGGGGGGSNAGPVARAVIEAYLADQAKGRAMAVSADTDGIGGS
ncbi:MAG: penicillin-binding protein 2 [Candidatus Latescibacteria bacterium]|nr:penicillin-binding protein 2 [Gemmatimonadaceae bacterium]MDP6017297.1 penicillin-binding protein 2 [Candidatus Latescibacterota bacterium]MDP7448002.1 penicillin-binding protein 2 [Candidatus Latescibacterota bacterium]HJP32211.1 penicillin-binding protein 2 [Candidatus Latescibacterota bacterium]